MKKYFLAIAIGFSLMGCSDDKVTKEMLVGDWQCQVSHYELANSKPTNDYGKAKETREYKAKFTIIDNKLYEIFDSGNKKERNIEDLKKGNVSSTETKKTITTTKMSFIKDTNDKFSMIQEIEVKNKENQTDTIDKREKMEVICTRIK